MMSGEKALYPQPNPHWQREVPQSPCGTLKAQNRKLTTINGKEREIGKGNQEGKSGRKLKLKLKLKQLPPLPLLLLRVAKIYGNVLDIVELNAPFIFKYPH